MNFSVKQFLGSKILQEHAVLSGKNGLHREISIVTVGEVPDLPKWLHGGELVLSTLYAFKDNKELLKLFIGDLIKANASGLCLKTSRFLKKLHPEIIDISNKNNFPIINVPQHLRWGDLIQKFYETALTEKIREEVKNQVKGDLLDELLRDSIGTSEEFIEKVSVLGCNIAHGCSAIVISTDKPQVDHNYTFYLLKSFEPNSLAMLKGNKAVIFLPPKGKSNGKTDIEPLVQNIYSIYKERYPDIDIHISISRFYSNPLDAVQAYKEALLVADTRTNIKGFGPIIFYEELGAYKLLLKLYETSPNELKIFFNETIAPILEYDKKHNSELVNTLEVYLSKEQNIVETANEMFLHRHSVRYRLQRIENITGLDVYRTEDRERLSLGLKAYSLVANLQK